MMSPSSRGLSERCTWSGAFEHFETHLQRPTRLRLNGTREFAVAHDAAAPDTLGAWSLPHLLPPMLHS